MTPLAQRLLRLFLKQNPALAGYLAQAACFDVSPVRLLAERTAAELRGTTSGVETEDPEMEHGGLLFTPSEFTWIEQRGHDGRLVGALVQAVDDQIGYTGFMETGEAAISGFLELQPDGEHFVVRRDLRFPARDANDERVSAVYGGWIASCLLLINAPRGVERATSAPHKGLARDVRRAGLGELKPAHTIRLSTAAGEIGDDSGAPTGGSPKVFHFCRSHVRRLSGGRTTRVRAHWRGDPALGIGDGDYRVTP